MTRALLIAGILLYVGVRIFTSLAAKGGFAKKWQLRMLGEPSNGKPSKPDEIVM
jgi:hypothetical protein